MQARRKPYRHLDRILVWLGLLKLGFRVKRGILKLPKQEPNGAMSGASRPGRTMTLLISRQGWSDQSPAPARTKHVPGDGRLGVGSACACARTPFRAQPKPPRSPTLILGLAGHQSSRTGIQETARLRFILCVTLSGPVLVGYTYLCPHWSHPGDVQQEGRL